MGLSNKSGQFTYVHIKEGKLAVKKENQITYFTEVSGHICDIEVRDDEFKGETFKVLKVLIKDGDDNYLLQMRLSSGYGRAFCNQIKNVNLDQEVVIKPFSKEENGKPKTTVFMSQAGQTIKWFYTKDNNGDLPALKEQVVSGKKMWDNTDQQAFYINMLLSGIRPKLKHPAIAGSSHQLGEASKPAQETSVEYDDLPF